MLMLRAETSWSAASKLALSTSSRGDASSTSPTLTAIGGLFSNCPTGRLEPEATETRKRLKSTPPRDLLSVRPLEPRGHPLPPLGRRVEAVSSEPGGPAKVHPRSRFAIRDLPSPTERVAEGVATAMWEYEARLIAHAPAEDLVRRLPSAVVVDPVDERTCRLHAGSPSPAMLAGYLGLLGVDFTIEDPEQHPELLEALRTFSDRRGRAAGGG